MTLEERINAFVAYDKETGQMWWKDKSNRNVVVGKHIGLANRKGHLTFHMLGRTLSVHRVAWFLTYGKWPDHQIDHINGVKTDNRICNLRDVPQNTNMQNMKTARKDSKSGLLGVSKINRNVEKCWKACIKTSGKSKSLGHFYSPEEAHQAYLTAKRILHPGCTI